MNPRYYFQTCCNCGIEFGMFDKWDERLRESHGTFYCPNGHGQSYTADNREEKLRRERDRLKQQAAEKDDEIRRLEQVNTLERRSTAAYKGQVTKIKKRVGKGVCPCCNRQFQNLHKHLETEHPDYSEEKPALKVVGGAET